MSGLCGRGWAGRCARSKGNKCRCRCGGTNHGARRLSAVELSIRHARWSVVRGDATTLVIRDEGPWDQHPTVTNDAYYVVAALAPELLNRRLFYYDSSQRLDEIIVADGKFMGFRPVDKTAVA